MSDSLSPLRPARKNGAHAGRTAASLGKTNALYADALSVVEQTLDWLDGRDALYLSASLMELLLEQRAGDPQKFGPIASAMAQRAGDEHDLLRAETLYALAARWFDRGKDLEQARAARISGAEAFVTMATEEAGAGQFAISAHHIQSAVEAYRRIGKEQARVATLLQQMEENQQRAVDGFRTLGQTVDVTEQMKGVLDAVRGKPTLTEAVIALATISASPSAATLRATVREQARATPMQFMFARIQVDARTGRTTGRRDAASLDVDDDALASATFEHARQVQHLTASIVNWARHAVNEEHHIRDRDLLPLVRSSPFVPPGREGRFARGLAAGLRGDFMVAGALLIPQIENSLRYVLGQRGGVGYGLDAEGLQDAHQLDHLLASDLAKETFGEDIVFDLRGLLIERFGSNLRHREAHGLIEDADYTTTVVAYFWWLTLRLCVLGSLAGSGRRAEEPSPSK